MKKSTIKFVLGIILGFVLGMVLSGMIHYFF